MPDWEKWGLKEKEKKKREGDRKCEKIRAEGRERLDKVRRFLLLDFWTKPDLRL